MEVPEAEGNKATRKYRGVCQRSAGKWAARIFDRNKCGNVHLGTFETAKDAAMAYDKAAPKFLGLKARLNFPDPEADSHVSNVHSVELIRGSSTGSVTKKRGGGALRRHRGTKKRKSCSLEVKEGSIVRSYNLRSSVSNSIRKEKGSLEPKEVESYNLRSNDVNSSSNSICKGKGILEVKERSIVESYNLRSKDGNSNSICQKRGSLEMKKESTFESYNLRSGTCQTANDGLFGIFNFISEQRVAFVFRHRLDSQKKAEYKKIIRQHMDFEMIRLRLSTNLIKSANDLFRDLLLVANNALVYYSKRTKEYKSGIALRDIVLKAYRAHVEPDSQAEIKCEIIPSKRKGNLQAALGSVSEAEGNEATRNYRGVWQAISGSWAAQIYIRKRKVYLGTFRTAEDAAMAYDKAALKLQGQRAKFNFPWSTTKTKLRGVFHRSGKSANSHVSCTHSVGQTKGLSLCRMLNKIEDETPRRQRGKRKRKDYSLKADERSTVESDNLRSNVVLSKSTCKKKGTFQTANADLMAIFSSISEQSVAVVFRRRLDSQKQARYKKIIRQHVDYEMIRLKLSANSIKSAKDLFRDLFLLANNALVFYSKGTKEYKSGIALRDIVLKAYRAHYELDSQAERKCENSPSKSKPDSQASLSSVSQDEGQNRQADVEHLKQEHHRVQSPISLQGETRNAHVDESHNEVDVGKLEQPDFSWSDLPAFEDLPELDTGASMPEQPIQQTLGDMAEFLEAEPQMPTWECIPGVPN